MSIETKTSDPELPKCCDEELEQLDGGSAAFTIRKSLQDNIIEEGRQNEVQGRGGE